MQHSLQEGDMLENVTAEQWEVIKALAPQYGVEIYPETLKYGYPRPDYNGRLIFDGGKLQGSYLMQQALPFDKFILAIMGKTVSRAINVKLNDNYNQKIKIMKNKVWYKVEIATEEQNVDIYPTEMFDGIILETKELDDKTVSPRLYLNKDEMELLILKMREMMDYVKP